MEKKLEIIDKICEKHPSWGVEKGWSEYVGGMKDTGQWFIRKMLDCSESELQSFLDNIIFEENKPLTPLTEEEERDSKIWHTTPDGMMISEYQRKLVEKWYKDRQNRLLWGNKTT